MADDSAEAPKKSRTCGKLELWSVYRVRNELYSNVLVALKYVPQRSYTEHEFYELVSKALQRIVIPNLPLLSCQILGLGVTDPYYEFKSTSQVPVVLVRDCRDVEGFLRREHDDPPTAENLWRVSLLPEGNGFWVSFAYHHAIGDGSSGLIFHEHLLRALQDVENQVTVEVQDRPLPPAIEDCGVSLKVSWYDLLKEIPGILPLPAFVRNYLNGPGFYGGNRTSNEQRRNTKTGLRVLSLEGTDIEKLRSVAKLHGTSIHALLHASAVHCIDTDKRIKTSTPISLRPLLPEVYRKDVGNYVCCHFSMTPISSDVITTAKDFHAELHLPSNRSQAMRQLGLLAYIDGSLSTTDKLGGMEKFLLNRLNTTNDHCLSASLEVSNLGIWKAPSLNNWSVDDVHFTGSNSAIGEVYNLGVVTLAGGRMKIACTYRQGYIDEQEVSRFMQRLQETLTTL